MGPEEVRRRARQEGPQDREGQGRQGGRGGEEEPARDLQAEAPRGQAEAGPGRGGAIPERPPLGRHRVPSWAVRPLRRVCLGGRGADLLQEEAGEEEEGLSSREPGVEVGLKRRLLSVSGRRASDNGSKIRAV